jgi:hypothetical protein
VFGLAKKAAVSSCDAWRARQDSPGGFRQGNLLLRNTSRRARRGEPTNDLQLDQGLADADDLGIPRERLVDIQIAKGENVHEVQSTTLLYGNEQALKQALEAGQNLGQSETSLS